MNIKYEKASRAKRHLRIRGKIQGTEVRPRLCVFRSEEHMYASLIDDLKGHTLLSASSVEKEIKEEVKGKNGMETAHEIGKRIAQKAVEKGIQEVVFDRAGYRYHGRVKSLAEGAREGGLKF